MVRFFGIIVGLGFVSALIFSIIGSLPFEAAERSAVEEFHKEPRSLALASDGAFGKFDRKQLQRGLQVYNEVCSACHSLRLVSFRDIAALGYNEGQVKSFAAAHEVPSIDPDTGEASTRPGLPKDHFPSPYPNEVAARAANNNALPPDLSLITKAREGGAPYIYSLLTGFRNPETYRNEKGEALPADNKPGTGLHFNPWFANLNLAMAPPLTSEGQVTYGPENPKPTVDQMAKDVSAFLVWTAEPKLENRRAVGWGALGFLLIFTVLTYLSYRQIWADKKH